MDVEIKLAVDPRDPTPPFEQVRRQIADLIATGQLTHDTRLPPVRQLAGDLGLASGTVARAYRKLEGAGLVQTRRGGGTRVVSPTGPADESSRALGAAATAYLARARTLGYSFADALDALHRTDAHREGS